MADIKKELNAIKNAVYGREVRGSIHDGIKKINDEVENATDLSESAKHQVENIQQQVNQLVVEGDSSVEAAQARVDAEGKSYPTLKARLDAKETEFSSRLADNTNKIGILSNSKVYVENFPIIAPEVDDTARINRAIAELKNKGGGKLVFARKQYKITPQVNGGLQFTDMSDFEVEGNGAEIYCDPYLIDSSNTDSKRMIYIIGCKNFKIHGLKMKLQIDFNSSLPSGMVREDQFIRIYSFLNQVNENFEIYGNTFEYYGPQLHDPIDGNISRLSTILIGSDTNITPDSRLTNNFRIYSNHFKNCVGRTVYLLLARDGAVFGNTYEELGKLWYPNGDKGYGLGIGVRILGCKNISVFGNVINAYSGELVNYVDRGSILGFAVGQGVVNGVSEDIVITGNTLNFNVTHGVGLELDTVSNVQFHSNNIVGLESSSKSTYGVRFLNGYVAKDVSIKNNVFKHLKNFTVLESPAANYSNIEIDANHFIIGSNMLLIFQPDLNTKAFVGTNFFSDKNAFCEGAERKRIIRASIPPTTGTFTRGDICINSDWDIAGSSGKSPVLEWVYQFNDGTKNIWRPSRFAIYKSNTPPSIPAGREEAHVGLMYLDTSTNANGILKIFNGLTWIKPDGTV